MSVEFDICYESVQGLEAQQRSLYVVISELDESGRKEGDLWVPLEKLSDLITELQKVAAAQIDAVA